jgi:hypothetical protein
MMRWRLQTTGEVVSMLIVGKGGAIAGKEDRANGEDWKT